MLVLNSLKPQRKPEIPHFRPSFRTFSLEYRSHKCVRYTSRSVSLSNDNACVVHYLRCTNSDSQIESDTFNLEAAIDTLSRRDISTFIISVN